MDLLPRILTLATVIGCNHGFMIALPDEIFTGGNESAKSHAILAIAALANNIIGSKEGSYDKRVTIALRDAITISPL